jgi:hypothetical protein
MSTSTRSFFIEMPAASKEVAHRSNYNTISERNMSTDEAFVCAKDMAMSTSTKPFGTVTFQDGSVAVNGGVISGHRGGEISGHLC